MNVSEAVLSRRSIRAFQDRPVSLETVRGVLENARWAPSGCNFQPWEATVLTGAPLHKLQQRLLASAPDDPLEYDFSAPNQEQRYRDRLSDLGARMYGAVDVQRADTDRRAEFTRLNVLSFGAPVLLLCHFPKLMKEAQWSDIGMWLQTIMLLLRGEGLDSCPQEYMGLYGRTIKDELGLPDDYMLFCGIAIGYRDPDAAVNKFERPRVPLDESVRFEGF